MTPIRDALEVDRASELPVGTQLAWRLRAMIAAGKLTPGERLPSVRELAAQAGVNANTARAIYLRLERDGLIESRQGVGTFVAAAAPSSADVERIAAEAVAEAAARRELRRQIARLEADLAAYPEMRSESGTHPLLRPKGHLPSFSELSAVRDGLIEQLREARAAAEREGERLSRARARRERSLGDRRQR